MGKETMIKSTVASSLEWDENAERAVDRVTAIALSARRNELGSVMLRVEALDDASLRKAVLLVARRLNHQFRITRGFAERMAVAAVQEYMQPGCITCGGTGSVTQGVVMVCIRCDGSGFRRYSDADRRTMIGGSFNKKAYEDALQFVRDSVRSVVTGAGARLGD